MQYRRLSILFRYSAGAFNHRCGYLNPTRNANSTTTTATIQEGGRHLNVHVWYLVRILYRSLPPTISLTKEYSVCIASIVVLDESLKYDAKSPEIPWNISPIIIWATAEVNLAIVSACLPMLRPIYNLARRIPNSKGSSGGGVYGHASSHTGAIKLTTVNIKNKGKGSDDGDSTYKLARSLSGQREGSIGSNSEYNSNVPAHDGRGHGHGPSTVITGQFRQQRQQKPQRSQVVDEERLAGIGGIVVTEEIGVRVSRLK